MRLTLLLLCFLAPIVQTQSAPARQNNLAADVAQSCLQAARDALGPAAEVLKCGQLSRSDALETVAALRIKQFPAKGDSVAVSKLVILRQVSSKWTEELAVDKQSIKNSAGYIEEFNTLVGNFIGYRVSFSDHPSDDTVVAGFTVWLHFLALNGRNEGIAVQISWNPSVKRFQEFAYDEDPPRFKPENKNPK